MNDYVLDAVIVESGSFDAELSDSLGLNASISEVISTPPYQGAYIAIPSNISQQFQTIGKRMTDNFEVSAIPYSSVSNPAGGKTITIAN